MMMLRATTKSELGADVTIIHAQRNNPFKFSPDGQAALEQLLRPPLRGFLAGPDAVTDAMHDLVSHAIGTVAGMRAAMEGMLQRFAPDELESKLAAGSVLDNVLPMHRRARLWQLYLRRFETLRHEAQDDFHALFGKAFLAAYEEQLQRLSQTTRADAGH
jgi:FHA domain-containing protein